MSLLLRVVPSSRVLTRLPKGGVASVRSATTTNAGEILPMPHITRFGLFGIFCTVVPGLLIGATISKKMANFLEENELFVPSDDDDDDD